MTLKNVFNKDFKRQLSGVAIIIFYFIGALAQDIILQPLRGVLPQWIVNGISILYSIAMIIALGWFAKDLFIKSYKDLKKNHLQLFNKYIKYWFVALAGMGIFNLLANQINGGAIAGNEETIRTMFQESPVFIYVSAVLIAPIMEEIVFRAGFYQIFKNKYVFIILSGLTFGAIHVLPGMEAISELAFVIPYSIPGFVFAYVLYDSKNIFVPMGMHFLHNGVLMALQVILLMTGAI